MSALSADRIIGTGERIDTVDQNARRASEAVPLGIFGRVDQLQFHVQVVELATELDQVQFDHAPVGAIVEVLQCHIHGVEAPVNLTCALVSRRRERLVEHATQDASVRQPSGGGNPCAADRVPDTMTRAIFDGVVIAESDDVRSASSLADMTPRRS